MWQELPKFCFRCTKRCHTQISLPKHLNFKPKLRNPMLFLTSAHTPRTHHYAAHCLHTCSLLYVHRYKLLTHIACGTGSSSTAVGGMTRIHRTYFRIIKS